MYSDHLSKRQIETQLNKKNYYEMLNIKNTASSQEIKKSYKKLALKFHPDKNSTEGILYIEFILGSKQAFSRLSEAYDILSDPSKRIVYDSKQERGSKITFQNSYTADNIYFTETSFRFTHTHKNPFFAQAFRNKFNARRQQKFDSKARQEREKNKKSQNQQRNKTKFNQKEQIYQKFKQFFHNNKKSDFSRRTSNRPNFYEYQNNIEKQIRLEKQRKKVEQNMKNFKILVLFFLFWFLFSLIGPSLKGQPIYSMQKTQDHRIEQFTTQLKSPFFVTVNYFQKTKDGNFKSQINRKIDLLYIKSLSRVCNKMMTKQEQIYERLDKTKSKKSRKKLQSQIDQLDMSSCDRLFKARQSNPQYFKSLFKQSQQLNEDI